MKQYLKMADVFQLPISDEVYRVDFAVISESDGRVIGGFGIEGMSSHAVHAINSHDELVQMNQELLAVLEQCAKELAWMIDKHNEQNMEDGSWKYDHQTPWEAMQLVVKAKGGAV